MYCAAKDFREVVGNILHRAAVVLSVSTVVDIEKAKKEQNGPWSFT